MDDADGYDYSLPEELIAQHGLEQRDQARLLVVRRDSSTIEHRRILDLPDLLQDQLDLGTSSNEPGRSAGHEQELLNIELVEEVFEHIALAPQDAGQPGKVHARPPLSRSRNPEPPNSPLGLSATHTRT